MTTAIIISICVLLIIAYVFDLTASKTKIPSVILLLLLGWGVRQLTDLFSIEIPDLNALLPAFGTIGLILIVLEGSLELEFNRSKLSVLRKSFTVALLSLVALAFVLALVLNYYYGYSFKTALINAIPLCVISSAVAIPSVKNQIASSKEFIVYESSLSDIIGILFFNFMAFNETINASSFGYFGLDLLIMLIISFIATIGLSFLLSRIDHHIKFAPIVVLIILIYEISKVYHLPALLFILLFGLFLGNLDELKRFKWIDKLNPAMLDKEVHKFSELVVEGTFLVRASFFLLFGFLIKTSEIINPETLLLALFTVAAIMLIRYLMLKIFRLPVNPLLFIAPRGLITILLFVSIPPESVISDVNKSLIIQVIIISALLMMIGLMFSKSNKTASLPDVSEITP
ncbi:MAG: cation:proton antiporter [Ferruginibacter sp.]